MKTKRLKLFAVSTAAFMALSGASIASAKLPKATDEFQTIDLKLNTKKLGKSKRGKPIRMTITTGTGKGEVVNPNYSGVPNPAVRALVYFDKSIKVNLNGVPPCDEGALNSLNTAEARALCPESIIGTGQAAVRIPVISTGPESPPPGNSGQATVNGKTIAGETQAVLTAFRTTKLGKYERIILFSRVGATAVGSPLIGTIKPAPKALKKKGYGTLLDVDIPLLAAGAALTRFSMGVGGTSWPAYTEASPGPYTAKVTNTKAKNTFRASCPSKKLKLTSEFQFSDSGTTKEPEAQLPASSKPFKCR